MSMVLRPALAALGAVLLCSHAVHAQVANGNLWPVPRLTFLTPNGGKIGSTFEATFAGTDVNDPEALLFSHPGINSSSLA